MIDFAVSLARNVYHLGCSKVESTEGVVKQTITGTMSMLLRSAYIMMRSEYFTISVVHPFVLI